jgi:hypothetical protein
MFPPGLSRFELPSPLQQFLRPHPSLMLRHKFRVKFISAGGVCMRGNVVPPAIPSRARAIHARLWMGSPAVWRRTNWRHGRRGQVLQPSVFPRGLCGEKSAIARFRKKTFKRSFNISPRWGVHQPANPWSRKKGTLSGETEAATFSDSDCRPWPGHSHRMDRPQHSRAESARKHCIDAAGGLATTA